MNRTFLKILQPIVLLVVMMVFFFSFREDFATAKIVHLLALISWFAGLFYLPRLFVYHAMSDEKRIQQKKMDEIAVHETLKIMEYKLFYYIMTPAAVVTLLTGFWIIDLWQWQIMDWLWFKLALIGLLVIYHIYCWWCMKLFAADRNPYSHVFYRVFNELPTLLLIAVVILVVLKP